MSVANQATPPAPPDRDPRHVRHRRRRWAWRILALLTLILLGMVVRAAWLVKAQPDYWQENRAFLQQTPTETLDDLALTMETRLPREWTRPIGLGDGVRDVRVNFDEVNAWLAVRLRPYLDNQGITLPPEIGQFMLTQRDGQLVLAFDYTSTTLGQRVASVYLTTQHSEPEITSAETNKALAPVEAALRMGLEKLMAGDQSLGRQYAVNYLAKLLPPDNPRLESWLEALKDGKSVPVPILPVDGRRKAVVTDLVIEPTGLIATVRVFFATADHSAPFDESGVKPADP